ncbi:MAG: hydrogenase nickel incorporation protein HypB [Pseudomonadota bacterium]|nr:hydrogenase nickel incorporation protein HypB [Pseudomonadota bacterium]
MCTTCGCGGGGARINGRALAGPLRYQQHQAGTDHRHAPAHAAGTEPPMPMPAALPEHAHAPGISQARMVRIEQDILAKNDAYARANRERLQRQGIFALNLVSSPGSGKTTLLVRTIERLRDRLSIAVVEGDQQTDNDAERIRATGAPAVQINTGKGCHLDAHMVGRAIGQLAPRDGSLLLIENVGNLVCPAGFDLGEAHKVAILSVTEGEDKPLKYPDMFRAADLMLLNKCDLLPYLQFDADLAEANARRVNPGIRVLRTSASSGAGLDAWLDWILLGCSRSARSDTAAAGAASGVAAR